MRISVESLLHRSDGTSLLLIPQKCVIPTRSTHGLWLDRATAFGYKGGNQECCPMIDPRLLTENLDLLHERLGTRSAGASARLDELEATHVAWKQLKQEIDAAKFRQGERSQQMKVLKGDEQALLRQELKELSDGIKEKQKTLNELEEKRDSLLLFIPNLPKMDVPIGDETHNLRMRSWGTPRTFEFTVAPHWEIGARLGILDFERAQRMSGSRFSVLIAAGARLERALIEFMLDMHRRAGYIEISPPLLVKREAMVGTGQLPNLEADAYKTAGEDPYYLIPTAEVVLVNHHREEILESAQLPVKYAAATPCFRSEAGSYGRDVRGLIRQHQFTKVEMVQITTPADSDAALEAITGQAEAILQALELPYQVILLSTGDMGFSSAKTYDLEVWIPSESKYREISSCSNCMDFQARRARIRYRAGAESKPELVHTLNGSGLAVGRTLLALLENGQQADGSVILPAALRPFLGGAGRITAAGLENID